ncbi:MAG: hypothetical protein JW909_04925 [Planctomycetes bacterium]|nr:hypothetical protein [Planctomycetota bacterium]
MKAKGILALGAVTVMLASGCGSRGLGIGFIVGEPDGLAIKGWTDRTAAVNTAFAWPKDAFYCHADYVYHNFNAVDVRSGDIGLYMGLGGRAAFVDDPGDDAFGVRVPLGLTYTVEDGWLDIFVEIVPSLTISPESDVEVDAAVGMHIFIK